MPAPQRVSKQALEQAIRAERKAALIVNTGSRRGRRLYRDALAALAAHGITLAETHAIGHTRDLSSVMRTLVEQGHRLIIVGGGDGTISAVVDHCAFRDVVVGLLPLGTANSFVRSLGIPLDVAGAVEVIARGKVADVDLVKIEDDHFANTASIGLATLVAKGSSHGLKQRFGKFGYLLVAAKRFLAYRPFRCRLEHDGRRLEDDVLDILIANGRYQGGLLVAEEAHVDSRSFLLRVVRGRSRWRLAGWWLWLALRLRGTPSWVETIRARHAHVTTDPPFEINIDGEVHGHTPARIEVVPNGLKLMVPRDFADADDAGATVAAPSPSQGEGRNGGGAVERT